MLRWGHQTPVTTCKAGNEGVEVAGRNQDYSAGLQNFIAETKRLERVWKMFDHIKHHNRVDRPHSRQGVFVDYALLDIPQSSAMTGVDSILDQFDAVDVE